MIDWIDLLMMELVIVKEWICYCDYLNDCYNGCDNDFVFGKRYIDK